VLALHLQMFCGCSEPEVANAFAAAPLCDEPEREHIHRSGASAMSDAFAKVPPPGSFRDVSPADVIAHRDNVRLVDVREPDEFTGELGHIDGAELVPLATVVDAATGWDKDSEIVLVCRSGGRSGRAAGALAQTGFTRLSNLVGGMLRWNEEQHPVVR